MEATLEKGQALLLHAYAMPPSSNFLTAPYLMVGWLAEQNVARVLRELPEVTSVRLTEPNSDDDVNQADMFVRLRPPYQIPTLDELMVQVKAQSKSKFRYNVGKLLRRSNLPDGEDERTEWIMRNGAIGIVGGYKRAGNDLVRITDQEIIESWTKQRERIARYHHSGIFIPWTAST
jgi:hypothetical protein